MKFMSDFTHNFFYVCRYMLYVREDWGLVWLDYNGMGKQRKRVYCGGEWR